MLLSVQAGFDARVPLSLDGDGSSFQRRLESSLKGTRVAWGADFKGHTPCEAGVLEVCRKAMQTLESLGCIVEEAAPDFDFDALWQATVRLRGWQQGAAIQEYYNDPAKRSLLKPEAVYEIETGMRANLRVILPAASVDRAQRLVCRRCDGSWTAMIFWCYRARRSFRSISISTGRKKLPGRKCRPTMNG